MDQKTFKHEMAKAKTFQQAEPERQDYWAGYQRGLRRAHHGDNFGTAQEHRLWLSLANDTRDESRKQRGEGYRAGLQLGGMETPSDTKYLLSIDSALWAQLKSTCALRGMKIKDAFSDMIQKFIS